MTQDTTPYTTTPPSADLTAALMAVFRSPNYAILTDNASLRTAALHLNMRSYLFSECDEVDAHDLRNVVVAPTSDATIPDRAFFRDRFARSSVLVVPLSSFSGSFSDSIYTLSLLAATDLTRSTARNVDLLAILESATEPLEIRGAGSDLSLVLSDEIFLMNPKLVPHLEEGEWASVAQFLEVGLVPDRRRVHPPHNLGGTASAAGVVVAHHRFASAHVASQAAAAWDYIQGVMREGGFPLCIEVESSRLMDIRTASGPSILAEVLRFVDADRGGALIEVAFASNYLPLDLIDWNHNSQLNESAGGFHLAVGTGEFGAHIDFVCPRAGLVGASAHSA